MNKLKDLRNKKGYTQLKVQILTGIDQGNYSKIEKGERVPSLEQCKRLALLFDTSIDYLIGLTDVKEPYPRSKKYQELNKFDIRDK